MPETASACTISTNAVAFGSYDPRSASADAGTATLTLLCDKSVNSPLVALGPGSANSFSPRSMANGSARLNYNLYSDATYSVIWGDGSAGTSAISLTGGVNQGNQKRFTRTIYGRAPALQNVRAGTYSDTLIVTVTF